MQRNVVSRRLKTGMTMAAMLFWSVFMTGDYVDGCALTSKCPASARLEA